MNASDSALTSIFTNKIIVWILAAALVFLFATLAGCIISYSRDVALDYASIVLACASAIVAFLPVFFDKFKGIIITASVILGVASACCFLDKHAEHPLPIVMGLLFLSALMLVTLIYVSYRRRGFIGMGYDAHFTLIIFIEILIVGYAFSFTGYNLKCLLIDPTEVCKIWYWW
ncbi:hypothetical protein ABQJ54_15520 [Rhodanobacter sp. Si-c]|uniref:Bax inhibitor-1/YccA family protein n=1 Tax=Rhodanobacter lycopersici TaxID=3162487 RepID=A0ABV3QH41_9GAMM